MGNMGSAHPLVEVNVSFKFEGNPSISKGVIERTRIGDGPTDRRTRQSESSIAPPTFCGGGIIIKNYVIFLQKCIIDQVIKLIKILMRRIRHTSSVHLTALLKLKM